MMIDGKRVEDWIKKEPQLREMMAKREVCWLNPEYGCPVNPESFNAAEVAAAEKRLERFAPYLEAVFPETVSAHGQIESPLLQTDALKREIEAASGRTIGARLLMKADNLLPISGSIKARGGIYEVLKTAEHLAFEKHLLRETDDYAILASPTFHDFFSQYAIAVGSTGNLGLSIGIAAAKLGFQTIVHMSRDAQQWKKDLLRKKGAIVQEYDADYSAAVKEGRRLAALDSRCHFIDDESSPDLFAGYATAAGRLKAQLDARGIPVDAQHPLFVYLPCGVGGGPGGLTFGLKQIFGESVHAFFVEPVAAPCFLLGLLTGLHNQVSVRDFGLDNRTAADGLAVPRPSAFALRTAGSLISGCLTVTDEQLFRMLKALADTENQMIEPSAAAGMLGPQMLISTPSGQRYLQAHRLTDKWQSATQLFWATGGGMVPQQIQDAYYEKASRIC